MPLSLQLQITKNKAETTRLVKSVIETLERLDRRIQQLETNVKVLSAPPPPK